jgi:CheY-like chemotaxis protein
VTRFVLVVDDDPDIREVLCGLLGDEGHRAVGVPDGQKALALLRSGSHPCLILLDLMMPVMDGPTFRAQQLGDPTLRGIPVAVITAAGPDAAGRINAEALLFKPLSIEDVLQVVERFCPVA